MKNLNRAITLSLAITGLFFSAAASAGLGAEEAPSRSVESCVAEIRGHADYSDAGRVLHEIETTGRRSLAYRFRIATKVFGAADGELIRQYTTKCIVYGDDQPAFFKITETQIGA